MHSHAYIINALECSIYTLALAEGLVVMNKSLACGAVTALHRSAQWSSGCVMDCQVRGPRFKPRPGQKFGSGFLLHAHHLGAVLVDNIWHVRRRAPVSSVRLTSPSFVRRRHLECIT